VPELIFGHLLTSSNYNDNEKKVTGGRNGYGAKLCNIFSTEFIVETADSRSGRKFRQVFSKNMNERSEPRITPSKDDYTQITFRPDLAKFGLAAIDDDFEALVRKRVYDMAGCCSGVKVFYNDERIKIKNFKEYVELYMSARSTPAPIVHEVPARGAQRRREAIMSAYACLLCIPHTGTNAGRERALGGRRNTVGRPVHTGELCQ